MWDEQWSKKQRRTTIFERFASVFRRTVENKSISHFTTKYFQTNRIYIEAGCGTGEASINLSKHAFTKVGLDISPKALKRAKSQQTYDHYILGDIFNSPFKESSIDGIWNVGVMEHFDQKELALAFGEFSRVLKDEGCCLLFWPWTLAPSHIIFNLYERTMNRMGRHKQIFPNAPSMMSKKLLPTVYKSSQNLFNQTSFHFPWIDLTHCIIIMVKNNKHP